MGKVEVWPHETQSQGVSLVKHISHTKNTDQSFIKVWVQYLWFAPFAYLVSPLLRGGFIVDAVQSSSGF